MPLRDHFHPPLSNRKPWEAVHNLWPSVMVLALARTLPSRYEAEPGVHSGASVEIDVATFEADEPVGPPGEAVNGGGVATAVWAPARPTLALKTDWPAQDEHEVRVYDGQLGRRLVAAVEVDSPANKDRPEHLRAFVAKCAALLQQRVSVTIVDVVTARTFNLYQELLELIGRPADPAAPPMYAVALRGTKRDDAWLVEAWEHALTLGQPLPTLPLWLADNLVVPLDLETTYEDTCRALRIR
jgi:hypothetical protein